MRRAALGRDFLKHYSDAPPVEVPLYNSQVCHVAGEVVDIIDQNGIEELFAHVISETVESRTRQDGAAPGFVHVRIDNEQPIAIYEPPQFRDLRIDSMSLFLFFTGNTCAGRHPDGRRMFNHCSICLDLFVLEGTPSG